MLRLKIGQNFLLTEYNEDMKRVLRNTIPYMMACFKGVGKMATTPDCYNAREIVKTLQELRVNELYILQHTDILQIANKYDKRDYVAEMKYFLQKRIKETLDLDPSIKIKVINTNAYYQRGEYKLAQDLYDRLLEDNTSILSALPNLEMYKTMTKRLAAIPEEIKVIDNDLRKLNKEKAVCDRTVSLKAIEYLKLINSARLNGNSLELVINKLPIYPSESLGKIFSHDEMRRNPYLYKAAKYIYQGGHFEMVPTRIRVGSNFYPEFVETIDHRFDSMLKNHNWSTIGYPHFGVNHFCAGEFNDVIAHGREYGLDYYFIALKQYLTTANMRDTAGYRVWWYPIYNDAGEMIYCAGFDIALEEFVRKVNPDLYNYVKAMPSWEDRIDYLSSRINFREEMILQWGCSRLSYYHSHNDDSFLAVCQEKEPEVYEEIMKGREN